MGYDIAATNVLRLEERPGAASAWSYPSPRSLVEHVVDEGQSLVIVLRAGFAAQGIHFFTPDSFSQQLAYMNRPTGYVIPAHVHNPVHRDVFYTLEVLFIKSGKVRVDFYTTERDYLESRVLAGGDVIFLASGGHGFEMLEPTEMIEIKQGPYAGEQDKTRFPGVQAEHIAIAADDSRRDGDSGG